MKKTWVLTGLIFLFLMQFSCKGVKNVSGTLTKSGSGSRRDYSKTQNGDYTKAQAGVVVSQRDTAVLTSPKSTTQPAAVVTEPVAGSSGETYRKDYGRVVGGSINGSLPVTSMGSSNADVNERLVKQYADMDRLADLVLYELNIVERRWDLLLGKFKMASLAEREKISANLDLLNADQLKLYKAHVKIYKEGKSDWDRTKKEVESTLLSVRGISEK